MPDGSDLHVGIQVKNQVLDDHFYLDILGFRRIVLARGYNPPEPPVIARDGRWLNNLFDPDGTRTEFMIRKPVETPCCSKLNDPYI